MPTPATGVISFGDGGGVDGFFVVAGVVVGDVAVVDGDVLPSIGGDDEVVVVVVVVVVVDEEVVVVVVLALEEAVLSSVAGRRGARAWNNVDIWDANCSASISILNQFYLTQEILNMPS